MVLGLLFLVLGVLIEASLGILLLLAGFVVKDHPGISRGIGIVCMIPLYVTLFRLTIQRSHDMNWSGWTSLLVLIPFVGLIWLFIPGTQGKNRFGHPPPPTPAGVKIGAFIAIFLGILEVIGLLLAISLPAYRNHLNRARSHSAVQIQQHGT
jgi:uncharacterized membrane protein YhaH (DUF805 family)